ncbi:hypothetical protein D3C86_1688660 [compost metagenome]
MKTPVIVDPAAEHEQQAIVLRQLLKLSWLTLPGKVTRGGAKNAAILRSDWQRHQARVFRLAVPEGNVHRLAEQVGDAVPQ